MHPTASRSEQVTRREDVADLKQLHNVSCELSFIWGKMKTIARETAIQIALRSYFKEVWGKVSVYVLLVKGEYMQSNKYFLQKVSASHEESTSPRRILVLF